MKKCHQIKVLGKEIVRCKGHKTLVKDYPEDLPIQNIAIDELIDCFEDRMCRWIFKPAEILLKTERDCGEEESDVDEKDPDVDFAILAILNAVPEMLAQFQGHKGEKPDLYEQGILYIFPMLKSHTHKTKIVEELLYGRLRSGIAHMALTSTGILLERRTKDPITPCYGSGNEVVVIVNVPKWYKQTKKRVKYYISELKDPDPLKDDLRSKFRKRMEASN